MPKYLQIQIPKDCEKSWDAMQQQEHGKFCASCQKTVTDFTRMTDEQLVQFFKSRKDNVCGRFTSNQLDTDFLIPAKKIAWLKYFFQITIPAFLFSSKIMAQGKVKVLERSHVSPASAQQSKKSLLSKTAKLFSGIKIDENVYADKIVVKPEAYQIKENKCTLVEPEMKSLVGRLGGAISFVQIRKTNVFKSSKTKLNKTFTIYPNPIVSSSELFIKWNIAVAADQTIEIYNESGILLQKELVRIAKNDRKKNLNLAKLLPATYTIKVIDNKTRKSSFQQLIVQ